MADKTCPVCGKPFQGRPEKKTCSRQCLDKLNQESVISFRVPIKAKETIERIAAENGTGAKEVVLAAVDLYDGVKAAMAKGFRLALIGKDGTRRDIEL